MQPPGAFPPMQPVIRPRWSGMAIAGFVLSFFCGLLGLIFSILGLNECSKGRGQVAGKGLAIAGLVISIISMIGTLAAVAIPSFMKYMKKSKNTEVMVKLHELRRSAEAYHMEMGNYPPTVEFTPPQGSCCPGKCSPNPALWELETWKQLDFALDEPHYYSYSFRNNGTSYAIVATGDLDCDGTYSTFEMSSETSAVFKHNELE